MARLEVWIRNKDRFVDVALYPSILAATFTSKMHAQMIAELKVLSQAFHNSNWPAGNLPEPCIGDQDCHELAENYGARGHSCFVVFVHDWGNQTYDCRHETCLRGGNGGPLYRSLEAAISHQRPPLPSPIVHMHPVVSLPSCS